MRSSGCQRENPEGASFCGGCGARLSKLPSPRVHEKFESWAWRINGEAALLRHAWGEADEPLRRALSIAEAIGQPRHTWLSHVALGRLDAANGRRESVLGRYRSAWAIIADLRARTQEPTLRAGLESSPLVREVEDLAGSE
jgi:hypothetical protein